MESITLTDAERQDINIEIGNGIFSAKCLDILASCMQEVNKVPWTPLEFIQFVRQETGIILPSSSARVFYKAITTHLIEPIAKEQAQLLEKMAKYLWEMVSSPNHSTENIHLSVQDVLQELTRKKRPNSIYRTNA